MRPLKLSALILFIILAAGIIVHYSTGSRNVAGAHPLQLNESGGSTNESVVPSILSGASSTLARYRLDASQSRFMVRAFAGGLLWFKGHDHFIAVRDFSGEVQLTPSAISPASLQMTIRAESLVETRDVFTEQQKQIINRELREIVLETNKYPEITFKSTDVTVNLSGGQVEAKIGGDLTLHGVTRHIVIPTEVTLSGSTLRARGEFTINRSDYNVKATSAFHGTVRVRDNLKFTFDIVAQQI
ncbi:MAG: hypothetical protein AUG51_26305 [Acidobacteria bacterium 13_1_20CM_3_53_8]|nr:MAG: hypothetical protein AUG51_26305 [Acidobacteria bacterium 13_1_20CM_3_53_8]